MSDPRKLPLVDRFEEIRRLTRTAREAMARDILSPDAVLAAVAAAATEGHNSITITPPKSVDLRATEAWKETEPRLREMGFSTEPVQRGGSDGRIFWGFLVTWPI